jgi:hypothetical protein
MAFTSGTPGLPALALCLPRATATNWRRLPSVMTSSRLCQIHMLDVLISWFTLGMPHANHRRAGALCGFEPSKVNW